MEKLSKQILSIKGMGRINFDASFTVTNVCNTTKLLLKSLVTPTRGSKLLEFFPELVGSETLLTDVIQGKSDQLQLQYVNRIGGE